MKKIYILLLFSICSFFVKSQHTLTAVFNPVVGDVQSYVYLDTIGIFLGSSGTSQTWNYTGVVTQTWTSPGYTYVPMSSVPNNFMFPTGTIATDDGSGYYNVWSNNSTKVEGLGTANSTFSNTVAFSDPYRLYTLPFSLGSINIDTYSVSIPSSSYNASGNFTTTADGTGTLQLPWGTYSNVLKLTYSITETATSGTVTSSSSIIQNEYYSAISKFPLLTVSSQTYNSSTSGTVYYKSGYANGIFSTNILTNKNSFAAEVFPNPVTNGRLTISDPKTEINSVTFINLIGQNIKTINFEDQKGIERKTIDVSDLPKGIYYLQLSTKEAVKTQKIIIE